MFGEKLKQLRKQRNISQHELSKISNVSYGFISELETGKKRPSLETAEKLSRALGVAITELISEN
ncbi:helix-turn-helix domain-containing protein [Acetivibrio cellulolyticus]|uniref:helix-turn-helix domain-containing protein n=1 Tax=Acetivibrio cellulolyticus TaxID=35830 RepID=UPI0001E2C790|nr:helix-turn-helix transcriptional regulator [Acetivibrio cellulolyticus]